MDEEHPPDQEWAKLPKILRERRDAMLETRELLWQAIRESGEEPETDGGLTRWINEWTWLIPLADAAQPETELYRFYPMLSHAILRLRLTYLAEEDYAWCEALAENEFRVSLVRPKPFRRYGFEVETEPIFEGDVGQTVAFLKDLAAKVIAV